LQPDSAAAAAGFQPGDLVLAIDGHSVESFADMQRIVSTSAGETLVVTVERNGTQLTLKATPALKEVKDTFGNVHRIGILGISRSMGAARHEAAARAARAGGLDGRRGNVVRGRPDAQLYRRRCRGARGRRPAWRPIRIAQMSGQVATMGFVALIHLAAVLSVSIGLLNLFPIPLLDGGHLCSTRSRPCAAGRCSDRAQEVGFRIGLAIVLMLMIFATFNDIIHLTTS
jgi:regulator of sigma E protease